LPEPTSILEGKKTALMSTKGEQLLDACERGELQTVRELIESKAVDPNRVAERRFRLRCHGWLTNGWTPLYYASA
jgi:hypothetical protein